MMKKILLAACFCILTIGCQGQDAGSLQAAGEKAAMPEYDVAIKHDDAARQVDVTVDGQPWTSYCYWENLKKPVLFPLLTDDGRMVNRGFPKKPIPGERVDHPHHFSCWFNYGDVNQVDFWSNSDSVDQTSDRYGVIAHREVLGTGQGKNLAWCDVAMDWVSNSGEKLLEEKDRIYFRAAPGLRIIDRIMKLTAVSGKVNFGDTKEGMFAIRLTRALEEPSDQKLRFVDQHGKITDVPELDNSGVDGYYLASSGLEGSGDVWGTRAKWCILRGTVEGKDATVGIFDHPDNPGYPTHWHARGYGLFAANPFGWNDFTYKRKQFNFSIEQGETISMSYRIVVASNRLCALETEKLFSQWLADCSNNH